MARKQRSNGSKGRPGAPGAQSSQGPRPPGGGAPQQSPWAATRDAIRRDVQQAVVSLAFAERVAEKLDGQRRLYQDFPRVMEAMRSGALERLAASLGRIYEDGRGQTVDVQRFLRDLPLATAHLAAKERASHPPPPSARSAAEADASPSTPPSTETPAEAAAPTEAAAEAPPATPDATATATPDATATATPDATATATPDAATLPAETTAEAAAPAEPPAPPSPRLELRSRLLAAAAQIGKAALGFRRNVATVRRACSPRRGPGPWRSDREVLEEARRAVDFVQKMYDTYAEAWADQPLESGAAEGVSAEVDRFLAWTQLDRYAEQASSGAPQSKPPPSKPPESAPPSEPTAEPASEPANSPDQAGPPA